MDWICDIFSFSLSCLILGNYPYAVSRFGREDVIHLFESWQVTLWEVNSKATPSSVCVSMKMTE